MISRMSIICNYIHENGVVEPRIDQRLDASSSGNMGGDQSDRDSLPDKTKEPKKGGGICSKNTHGGVLCGSPESVHGTRSRLEGWIEAQVSQDGGICPDHLGTCVIHGTRGVV